MAIIRINGQIASVEDLRELLARATAGKIGKISITTKND